MTKLDPSLPKLLNSVEALCSTLKTHRPEKYPHVKNVLKEIAKKCGVTYPTVSSWVMDRRFKPSEEMRQLLEAWSIRCHFSLSTDQLTTYQALLSAVKRVRAAEEQNR